MGIVDHAKTELALIGYKPIEELEENDPNRWVQECILELCKTFANQGHSGSSAPYVLGMFYKLGNHEPISPLTGEESEWEKVDFQTWQNKRCSRVLKTADGKIFDVEGKIFEEPDGARFVSNDSCVDITFPYIPKTEIVKIESKGI